MIREEFSIECELFFNLCMGTCDFLANFGRGANMSLNLICASQEGSIGNKVIASWHFRRQLLINWLRNTRVMPAARGIQFGSNDSAWHICFNIKHLKQNTNHIPFGEKARTELIKCSASQPL
jgi:hypothetical protein